MCKLLLNVPTVAINYVCSSLWSLGREFSPFSKLQGLEIYYTMNDHHIRYNTSADSHSCCGHNIYLFKFVESYKRIFDHLVKCMALKCITL